MICYNLVNYLIMGVIMMGLKLTGIKVKWMKSIKWFLLAKKIDFKKSPSCHLKWRDFYKSPKKNSMENINTALKNYQPKMVLEKLMVSPDDLLRKDSVQKWLNVRRHKKVSISCWRNLQHFAINHLMNIAKTLTIQMKNNL